MSLKARLVAINWGGGKELQASNILPVAFVCQEGIKGTLKITEEAVF